MQPSTVPRRKYPDQCEREQSHLRRFAKWGLAREETGDDKSGSDSSHAEEFWFGVGYKRDGGHVVACSDNLYINLRKFWQLKSISGNTMWPVRNNYLKRK